ncbi:acyltransferase family protein [Actomonas aquatica]|uniref:Heparan-alpha-glucosaminide N-acetyltransferase domain-containing protein n=1 Tax=Actomonas aquatica TaxID=2866162 RepID=A0ABZ1C7W4_9BACT|nr:heparan-alpha-glucosaminide N-acetyltransferase domain-containing protein [Opitutus sp. WL0086]WRQ87679.1 heparan-alpha-glucosaminide N-acetyltransferase domain-containing protein [Opitutus sp. WL0086]
MSDVPSAAPKPDRLLALDALRGFTIAAMIVVNTPGDWGAVYGPLLHASWHGFTPTDAIFPFFLFIVGVSIALAYSKRLAAGADRTALSRKILVRGAKIFAVGLFLNLWPDFAFGDIRVAGVLQRIAVVFVVVALLFLSLPRRRTLALLTAGVLIGYWALLAYVPVPRDAVIENALATGQIERAHGTIEDVDITAIGANAIAPNLEPATNLAAWVDRHALPGAFYEQTWDPEGLLSTVPSLATALLGVLTGMALVRFTNLGDRLTVLGVGGVVALVLGYGWGHWFPLNKNLWTSSFVLVNAGWAMLGLALATALIDGLGWKRWAWPGLVFGANAITAYTLAGMLGVVIWSPWFGGESLQGLTMTAAQSAGAPAKLASLICALLYAAVVFLPVWVLHRKRIFIRL